MWKFHGIIMYIVVLPFPDDLIYTTHNIDNEFDLIILSHITILFQKKKKNVNSILRVPAAVTGIIS